MADWVIGLAYLGVKVIWRNTYEQHYSRPSS